MLAYYYENMAPIPAHSGDCGPAHSNLRIDTELEDGYVEGGYHPVTLGDTFGGTSEKERYKIIHKLGFGENCTVRLARDTKYALHRA